MSVLEFALLLAALVVVAFLAGFGLFLGAWAASFVQLCVTEPAGPTHTVGPVPPANPLPGDTWTHNDAAQIGGVHWVGGDRRPDGYDPATDTWMPARKTTVVSDACPSTGSEHRDDGMGLCLHCGNTTAGTR